MLLWLCGNKEKPKEQILLFFFFEFSFSSNQTLWEYKKKRKVEKNKVYCNQIGVCKYFTPLFLYERQHSEKWVTHRHGLIFTFGTLSRCNEKLKHIRKWKLIHPVNKSA